MLQTPQQVLEALKKEQYKPVYFLQGEEPYYIDLISDYIAHKVLSEAEKSFNLTVVYGKDQTVSQILTYARRFPIMAERQVVIVKEAQEMQDLNSEIGQKLLESYSKNPHPTTLLVFAHKHKILDGRKAISKLLDKYAMRVTTKKLYDNQLPAWIRNYVKEKNMTITEKATFMLQEFVGNKLERLANEIEKIAINLKKEAQIDDEAIQKYVGISKEYNVFELQRALFRRDIVKAHQIIQYFEANPKNNPVIPIIVLLFTSFSKLLIIHHTKNTSQQHLTEVLQVPPYFFNEYLLAAQHYPLQKVIENIEYLHQADLQSKGIDYPFMAEGQVLKEVVFKLMH